MTQVLEVDEEGALHLSPELLGHAKPRTRYILEVKGEVLVLRPAMRRPFWATATPEERAEAFLKWATAERPPAPVLPPEALRRESIYE